MTERPRLARNLKLPRYAFVPGESAHPRRAEPGAHGLAEPEDETVAVLFGIDLFNHGYFWEAHEIWEGPWRAAPEGSDRRLFLKALIRLAAAALKLRSGSPAGVRAHAPWCAEAFADLAKRHTTIDGLSPAALAQLAQDLAAGRLVLHHGAELPQPVLDPLVTVSRGSGGEGGSASK
jgi:uncharacterized protein